MFPLVSDCLCSLFRLLHMPRTLAVLLLPCCVACATCAALITCAHVKHPPSRAVSSPKGTMSRKRKAPSFLKVNKVLKKGDEEPKKKHTDLTQELGLVASALSTLVGGQRFGINKKKLKTSRHVQLDVNNDCKILREIARHRRFPRLRRMDG